MVSLCLQRPTGFKPSSKQHVTLSLTVVSTFNMETQKKLLGFASAANPDSDYTYMTFNDNVAAGSYTGYNYIGGKGLETAARVIGDENDASPSAGSDNVINTA